MRSDAEFQAYVTALGEVADLPRAHTRERDAIARRAAAEIEALDRSRQDVIARWVGMRDTSARLTRRVEELARRVDAPQTEPPHGANLAATAIPAALESLRVDLEKADQSWQWVQRHRERRAVQTPLPSAPVYTQPPAPLIPAPKPKASNTPLLLAIGGAVIVILIFVIIVMAI